MERFRGHGSLGRVAVEISLRAKEKFQVKRLQLRGREAEWVSDATNATNSFCSLTRNGNHLICKQRDGVRNDVIPKAESAMAFK